MCQTYFISKVMSYNTYNFQLFFVIVKFVNRNSIGLWISDSDSGCKKWKKLYRMKVDNISGSTKTAYFIYCLHVCTKLRFRYNIIGHTRSKYFELLKILQNNFILHTSR